MSMATGVLGTIAGRLFISKVVPALSALEPGRWPHPVYGPVVIPKTPELRPGEAAPYVPPFQLTNLGLVLAFGGLVLYAAKRKRRAPLAAAEDAPGDPVEACMSEVYGWDLRRMRQLRDAVADKPDAEELSGQESRFLDQIEDCLERVKRQFGSLEAAGLPLVACPLCSTDPQDGGSPPS